MNAADLLTTDFACAFDASNKPTELLFDNNNDTNTLILRTKAPNSDIMLKDIVKIQFGDSTKDTNPCKPAEQETIAY